MSKSAFVLIFLIIRVLYNNPAYAHSGGKDKNGCHTDRKTGNYHCHNGGKGNPPLSPNRSSAPNLNSNSAAPFFRSCKEARASGYYRMKRSDPGYRPALDRDNDGIACE
ncbi:excalibur calcium-binding domain-containing protein [Hirschia baltica]|uniref:Excalibur domain protein n=1 Tax=Hirschia baltica (strain ATCC 49814 / DSM 5838 / IFAM 1418) TaxID=582402 RepID=C6XKK5_HIRBI|nr:excalibur calcium-binding domain-containing protein [Hirschia baltica]ACT59572.1 Excalibur domain protein [Hirschia baltica ATCC 49814]